MSSTSCHARMMTLDANDNNEFSIAVNDSIDIENVDEMKELSLKSEIKIK